MKKSLVFVIMCLSVPAFALTKSELDECPNSSEMGQSIEATYDRIIVNMGRVQGNNLFVKMNQKLEERISEANTCSLALSGVKDVLNKTNTVLDEIEKVVQKKIDNL